MILTQWIRNSNYLIHNLFICRQIGKEPLNQKRKLNLTSQIYRENKKTSLALKLVDLAAASTNSLLLKLETLKFRNFKFRIIKKKIK